VSEWWQALGGGILLGAVFFGGLWWTVRVGVSARQPALWFLFSLLARSALTLAGFYLFSAGDWRRLLACLAGFTLARFLVTRFAGPPGPLPATAVREEGHAP
jgi:F1F0 ATPase subunit 2